VSEHVYSAEKVRQQVDNVMEYMAKLGPAEKWDLYYRMQTVGMLSDKPGGWPGAKKMRGSIERMEAWERANVLFQLAGRMASHLADRARELAAEARGGEVSLATICKAVAAGSPVGTRGASVQLHLPRAIHAALLALLGGGER